MKLKARTAALVAAAGVVAAGLSISAPASATLPTKDTAYAQMTDWGGVVTQYWAQADNKPGDGKASWIDVWTTGTGDHVDFSLEGGGSETIWAPANGSNVQHPNKNITRFRVCGPNAWGGDVCSDWKYLQPA
jgi:hypothetical protein